jgi:hypothetical protein
MFAPTTQRLLKKLNEAKGLSPGQVGYTYFADIKGDGVFSPRVYEVTSPGGAVSLCHSLNAGGNARKRCAAIVEAIKAAKKAKKAP